MDPRDRNQLTALYKKHLKKNGLLNKYEPPAPRYCSQCLGVLEDKWVVSHDVGHWHQSDACNACAEQQRAADVMDQVINTLTACGVPEMFQVWTAGAATNNSDRHLLTKDDDNRAAWDVAQAFISKHPWVVFGGVTGVGKTTWATALFNDHVDAMNNDSVSPLYNKRSPKPLWFTEAALFLQADLAHGTDGYVGRTQHLDKLCRCRMLLIDDLGGNRRSLTEWQGGAMRHLFDYRFSRQLPTLLTTNLDWDQLKNRYGEHIASRMIGHCKTMRVLSGGDRRS